MFSAEIKNSKKVLLKAHVVACIKIHAADYFVILYLLYKPKCCNRIQGLSNYNEISIRNNKKSTSFDTLKQREKK